MGESRLVIGVTGLIGSGKGHIAHLLEKRFRFQYVRYSLVLAEWHESDPEGKTELQRLGWRVMSGPGQLELNRRLIQQIDPTRDCAVDGLRHPIDYESLRKQFSTRFRLIYVETPDDVRFERLRHRFSTHGEFVAADSHLVESNIPLLKARASAILSGVLPLKRLVSELTVLVDSFRSVDRQEPGAY